MVVCDFTGVVASRLDSQSNPIPPSNPQLIVALGLVLQEIRATKGFPTGSVGNCSPKPDESPPGRQVRPRSTGEAGRALGQRFSD